MSATFWPSQRLLRIFMLAAVVVVVACSDEGPNAPATHTVMRGGVTHAPGLDDPVANCTSCHGADLMGGTGGEPSCYSCHGRKWP